MPSRYIRRGATVLGSATAAAAPIYVDADDNKLKYIPAGTGTTEVQVLDGGSAIGYTAGAGVGGTVTQITSITTGVTLSKLTGQITTVSATTAAGAEDTFTVTNTNVAATDVVVLSTTYAGAGTPLVFCSQVAAGTFNITISNLHAANALNAVLVINFVVIKGQTT